MVYNHFDGSQGRRKCSHATDPKVLLIGDTAQGSSYLVKNLEGHRCKCKFAASYQEAASLIGLQTFDLVFSPMRVRDISVFPLISLLVGSRTTLFYFQAVEEGCWWLPALRFGRECFGSYALRSNEFIPCLELIIEEIEAARPTVAESATPTKHTSPVTLSWLVRKPETVKPVRAEHPELAKCNAAG